MACAARKAIDFGQDWGVPLADIPALGDVKPWRLAVVLDVNDVVARIGLQPRPREIRRSRRRTAKPERLPSRRLRAGPQAPAPRSLVKPGDVFYVEAIDGQPGRISPAPDSGGQRRLLAMDPFTGRVLRDGRRLLLRPVGVQPRDPGAAPAGLLVQAASSMRRRSTRAIRPSSICSTRRSQIDDGSGESGRPQNFEGNSGGTHTLRFGIEHSINLMTVRLARDIGMPLIVEYAKRFGIYDNLPPFLSMSIGAGETTVLRMITAYSMFDNGGKRIKATLIDRIQDRWGNTIYKHDERICQGCDAPKWDNQPRADADRQPRAGDRSAHRLSDHLDHGGRDPARHRHRDQGGRQDAGGQDRHHQRRQGSLVRRLFARTSPSACSWATTSRARSATARRPRSTPRRSSATS